MPLKLKVLSVLFLILPVFSVSFLWYSPILFKGYHPDIINDQLVLARNLAESGKFTLYNDRGVVISSDMVKEFGEVSSIGNKLTARLYAMILKYFGILSLEEIALISIILNSLALFVFSLAVFYLFNIKTAVVFSFVYGLLPFNWRNVYALGNYEFAILFLSVFFLLFFLGKDIEGRKLKFLVLFFSGVFFALSALAKEAFLISILILFLFLVFKKKKDLVIPVFSAIFIIFVLFYLPSFLKGDNIYKNVLFNSKPDKELDFNLAGHLFPDYYTFRYEKSDFLEKHNLILNGSEGFVKSLAIKKAAANVYGYKINIFERITVGLYIISGHLLRLVSLEEIGGALIFGFMILGFINLKNQKKFLFVFFNYWIFLSIFIFSFIVLVSRSHLMDFGFALALLLTLGMFYFLDIIKNNFKLDRGKEAVLSSVFFMLLSYHLFLVNHIIWGKAYNENMLKLYGLANEIENKNIQKNEVIMAGLRHDESLTLNFITDKPIIVFRPETLEKIINEKKLENVLREFNIKYALEYKPELLEIIKKEGKIEIIYLNEPDYKARYTAFYKMWFLGLFR